MRILLAVIILIAPTLAIKLEQCEYKCKKDGGCTSKYLGNKPGKKLGSCFPKSFGGRCIGIPDDCSDCNKVKDCSGGSGADVGTGNCKIEDLNGKCLNDCFGGFSTGSKPNGVTVCGCRGNECYVKPKCKNWEDTEGNCLETCFGGFGVGATSDGGSLCLCSGNECYVDPCDGCPVCPCSG